MTGRTVYPNFSIESLRETEQLSSIAHRFGHDIGNPLTSIISFGSVLKRSSSDPSIVDKLPDYTDAIVRESWRVNLLNERLVMLFSSRKGSPETISLVDAISRAQQKIKARLAVDVTVSFAEDISNTAFEMDGDQCTSLLSEVLLNVAYHGENPLEAKATITPFENDKEFGFQINNIVTKLPDCPLEQLFNPFFSWPESSKYPGIGLCVAYSIAHRAGAKIGISTSTDPSLSFTTTISFPIDNKPLKYEATDEKDLLEIPSNLPDKIDILLIEDEVGVSSAIEKILSFLLGKKTKLSITIATDIDALRQLNEKKIDLILCDLNLKKTSGKEILTELTKSNPELVPHFAFITGDRGRQLSIDYLQSTGRPFLFKPFEPEDLLDLVFELLSEIR